VTHRPCSSSYLPPWVRAGGKEGKPARHCFALLPKASGDAARIISRPSVGKDEEGGKKGASGQRVIFSGATENQGTPGGKRERETIDGGPQGRPQLTSYERFIKMADLTQGKSGGNGK